jgi:hypothetical protein
MSVANAIPQKFFRGRNVFLVRLIFFKEILLSLQGSKAT